MRGRPNPHQQANDWHGLYAGSTSRDDALFTSGSVSHPAKMSLKLLTRILAEMQAFGWLKTGDTLVDPFGGRGTTAAVWTGLHPDNRAVTIELEPHFVLMQHEVRWHASKRLGRFLKWEILQGDSRKADELLEAVGACGVMSPPYADQGATDNRPNGGLQHLPLNGHNGNGVPRPSVAPIKSFCGTSPGQIGTLPDRDPVAILSPPYGNGVIGKTDVEKLRALTQDPNSSLYKRDPDGAWFQAMAAGYVNSEGNIDNLPDAPVCVTSPPYGGKAAPGRNGNAKREAALPAADRMGQSCHGAGYGETPGQIETLPDVACVTSPPYEASLASDDPNKRGGLFRDPKRRNDRTLTGSYDQPVSAVLSPPYEAQSGGTNAARGHIDPALISRHAAANANPNGTGYAENREGQIGTTQGETYSSACLKVYSALARAGVRYLAVVTKNPTRDGKLRRLDKLTARLLRQAGYRVVGWRRAWLFLSQKQVEALRGQTTLFDDAPESTRLKGRLSFFRRLHMAKGGVAAAWEDVFFAELA